MLGVIFTSVPAKAQPQVPADDIQILPPSLDSIQGNWTVVFRNTAERDITGFAADLSCKHSNGVISPRPITVDLAPALAWAAILKDSPDRDKVVTFRPGEVYAYEFPGADIVSVEASVKGVVFVDDTAIGDDARIRRVFSMRTDLAARKRTILNALQALSLSPAGPRSLRPDIERLPEGSPLRREMERV
ncbi:MAG: hypothetical protein WA182_15850, partial [Candidatus Sulfotelmatobacter sp.]